MLTHEVLCHDCAVDHAVPMGSRPHRCPRCRAQYHRQVKADLLCVGRHALLGVLSGGAVVGLMAVVIGCLASLAGCV
jgi:hypothetical protein